MNKSDLIEIIDRSICSKRISKKVVDEVFEIIINALMRDEKVVISGFGTFTSKMMPERKARNPSTREFITAKPRWKFRFKVSRSVDTGPGPVF